MSIKSKVVMDQIVTLWIINNALLGIGMTIWYIKNRKAFHK